MVNPSPEPTLRLAEAATRTSALIPLRLKAWPTRPVTKFTLPSRIPLFPSSASLALPSARHQLISPGGAGTQFEDCDQTVSGNNNVDEARKHTNLGRRAQAVFI